MLGRRPYYSLNAWLKQRFGVKVYKLALDARMSCPNRDGTLGTGGCIFCSAGGSGEFAAGGKMIAGNAGELVSATLSQAKKLVSRKIPPEGPLLRISSLIPIPMPRYPI